MIADDGRSPILMDFGSTLPGRIPIPNRSVALTQQDIAAEHCSMPFRAPELFDVRLYFLLSSFSYNRAKEWFIFLGENRS